MNRFRSGQSTPIVYNHSVLYNLIDICKWGLCPLILVGKHAQSSVCCRHPFLKCQYRDSIYSYGWVWRFKCRKLTTHTYKFLTEVIHSRQRMDSNPAIASVEDRVRRSCSASVTDIFNFYLFVIAFLTYFSYCISFFVCYDFLVFFNTFRKYSSERRMRTL